ncbi:hypothetical protein K438DRAFT_1939026, partial [Mycena galopus ATCC 62051]
MLSTSDKAQEGYKTRGQLEAELAELRKQLALAHQNVTVWDNILKEANATMVFQNVGLKKMKEALHQQKAATDYARLFKGKTQVLSSDEFTNQVKEMNAAKRVKDAGKEAKKVARQRRKKLREELEKEWAQMKEQHVAEVEAWSKTCTELLAAKTKKKDLPPKPKLDKKPQIPVKEDEDDDVDDEVMDDGEYNFLETLTYEANIKVVTQGAALNYYQKFLVYGKLEPHTLKQMIALFAD